MIKHKNFTPMHPQEIKGYLDHLYDKFVQAYEENNKLRRENKILMDELSKVKPHPSMPNRVVPQQIQPSSSAMLPSNQRYVQPPSAKVLKMGADWHIEGDPLIQLSLLLRLRFPAPICNVKISNNGQIAFTCNRRVFLFRDEEFYLVEDVVRAYNPALMTRDLYENYRCIFDFMDESLVVFYKNNVIKYTNLEREWSFPLSGVYHLAVSEGLLYIGTKDGRIHVFENEDFVKVIEHKELYKYFTVNGGVITGFVDRRISSVGKTTIFGDGGRVIAIDSSNGMVFYGGESAMLRICKLGNVSEIIDTFIIKKVILAIKAWNDMVIVSAQDKSVIFWDYNQRKSMRIVGGDNVVDIAANNDTIVCVDNSGSLRVWNVLDE